MVTDDKGQRDSCDKRVPSTLCRRVGYHPLWGTVMAAPLCVYSWLLAVCIAVCVAEAVGTAVLFWEPGSVLYNVCCCKQRADNA